MCIMSDFEKQLIEHFGSGLRNGKLKLERRGKICCLRHGGRETNRILYIYRKVVAFVLKKL